MVRARPAQECPTLAPLPALPGFRLQSYLGSGPSGHVYRARDELHSCDVAIKLLDPGRCTPSGSGRLATIASSPPVSGARRYEFVSDPVHPFVVMDLLPGENLLRRLPRTGPLAWREARTLGQAIAGALAVAHEAGHASRRAPSRRHHPRERWRVALTEPGSSPRRSSWPPSPVASHSPVSEAMSSPNSSGWSPPPLPNPRWGSSESSAQARLGDCSRVGKRSAGAATTRSPCA